MSNNRRRHRNSVSIRVSNRITIGEQRNRQIKIAKKTTSTRALGLSTQGLGRQAEPIKFTSIARAQAKQLKNVLSYKLSEIKKKKFFKVEALIGLAEDLDAISPDPDNHKENVGIIKDYTNLLIKKMQLSEEQQQAIDRLTGVLGKKDNFLNDQSDMAFTNFNRYVLITQLIVRIVQPKLVRQRQEGVCGVAAFMHTLIQQDPEAYAEFVMKLANNGSANIDLSSEDRNNHLNVKIKDDKLKKRPSSHTLRLLDSQTEYLDEADFIPLIGFRESANKVLNFSKKSPAFLKNLFGVTFHGEIKKWLKSAGYTDIKSLPLNKKADIKQLEEKLKDGYSSVLLTTGYLADLLVYDERKDKYPDYIRQILTAGHYIQVKGIHYNEVKDQIELSVITWGEEVTKVKIDYDLFKKIKGQSKLLICTSPKTEKRLETQAEAESVRDKNRLHPIIYINELDKKLKKILKNEITITESESEHLQEQIEQLIKIIHETREHKNGISWINGAKNIQDYLFKLSKVKDSSNQLLADIIHFGLDNTICPTIKSYNQFVKASVKSTDYTPEEVLIDNARHYKDVGSLLKLVKICRDDKALSTCKNLLNRAIDHKSGWLNNYETSTIEKAMRRAEKRVKRVKQKTSEKSRKKVDTTSKLKDTLKQDSAKRNDAGENDIKKIRLRIVKLADNMDGRIRELVKLSGNSSLPDGRLDEILDFGDKFNKQIEDFYQKKSPSKDECEDMLDMLKLNSEVLDSKNKELIQEIKKHGSATHNIALGSHRTLKSRK